MSKIKRYKRYKRYVGIAAVTALIASAPCGAVKRAAAGDAALKSRHYYLEGVQKSATGDYAEAYELFRHAYRSDTASGEAALEYMLQTVPMANEMPVDSAEMAAAVRSAKKVSDRYPADFFPVYDYAMLSEYMGDTREAVRVMERFHDLKPGHTSGLEALIDLYLDNSQFDESLAMLDEYRRIEGDGVKITLRKAGIHLAKGDTLAVIDEARRLVATNPAEPQYWVLKGQLENYVSRRDSALASFAYAEKLSGEGGGGPAKIQMATLYQEIGDSVAYDNKVYEALMADDLGFDVKKDLIVYYLTSQMRDKSDTSRGDKLLDTLLKQYPHEPELLKLAAAYSASKKEYDKALDAIRYCIDLEPSVAEHRNLAMYYAYMAELPEELDRIYHDAAEDLGPLKADFIIGYAQLLLASDRNRESIEVYKKLLERDFPGMTLIAPLDLSSLDKSTTLEKLNELMDIFQGAGDAYNGLGDDGLGECWVCYDNVLSIDPDNALALNNYSYFIVRDGGDIDPEKLKKAMDMSERAEKLDPRNPTYLDTRAWVLYRSGDIEAAYEKMKSALDAAKAAGEDLDAEYYDHMGDILNALGKDDEARDYWEKAAEKDPENDDIKKKLNKK